MSEETSNIPEDSAELFENNQLPTLWVDNVRAAARNDGLYAISFDSNLPSGFVEQARIMTTEKLLKEMVNHFCQTLDYFPIKEDLEEDLE